MLYIGLRELVVVVSLVSFSWFCLTYERTRESIRRLETLILVAVRVKWCRRTGFPRAGVVIGSNTDPDYLLGAGIDIKFLMRQASFHPDSDSAAVCCPITPDRGSIARDGCICLCDLVDGHFGF